MNAPEHLPPEKLPDPWMFDSEKLLRELDRIREIVLLIPTPTQPVYFATNNAVSAIFNLTETLRYLLSLHSDMQVAFRSQHSTIPSQNSQTPRPVRQVGTRPSNARRSA